MADSDHIKQRALLMRQKWYHGTITEFESERRVRDNGEFLVRECFKTTENIFILTIKWDDKTMHLPIRSHLAISKSCWLYTFDGEYCLPSVVNLVMFHWKNSHPLLRDSGAYPKFPVETAPPCTEKVSGQLPSTSATSTLRDRKSPSTRVNKPLIELNSIYTGFDQCTIDTGHHPQEKSTSHKAVNKGSRIDRKQIRYVAMSDNIDRQRTEHSAVSPCSPAAEVQMSSTEALKTLAARFTVPTQNGLGWYDLSSPGLLPPEIGPVTRALSPEAWRRVSQLCASRQFSPLLVADHLTAHTVGVLSHSPDGADEEVPGGLNGLCTLLHPSAAGCRADVVRRDRFLRLFIIASVLMPEEVSCAAKCLVFWLDVAQTLYAILRDKHSLSSVLTAIFSPQLMTFRKCWTLVNKQAEQEPRVFTVDELRVIYKANFLDNSVQPKESSLDQKKELLAKYFEQMQTVLADLHPLIITLVRSKQGSTVPDKSSRESEGDKEQLECLALLQDALMALTSAGSKQLWINELTPCLQDPHPVLFSLLTTPSMLALLLGPLKMHCGSILHGLVDKLEVTLQKIAEKREADT